MHSKACLPGQLTALEPDTVAGGNLGYRYSQELKSFRFHLSFFSVHMNGPLYSIASIYATANEL